jgi:hypothetical protein
MSFSILFKWVFLLLGYTFIVFLFTLYIDGLREDSLGCCDPIQRVVDSKNVIMHYVVLFVTTLLISTLLYFKSGRKFWLITLIIPVLITALTLREINLLHQRVIDFDSQVWKEKRPVEMAIDVRNNLDLMGKSRAEVIDLLGKPDETGRIRNYEKLYYHTSYIASISTDVTTNVNCVTLYIRIWNDEVDTVLLNCAQ